MRGSPLLRTLVVLLVLVLAALGLARLTGTSPASTVVMKPAVAAPAPSAAAPASFELLLSAAAKSVSLEAGGAPFVQQEPAASLTGSLEVEGEQPVIFLKVEWADSPPGHRFAKLRIDRPGKETLEHVFSAPGDIDDLWEP